MKTYKTNKDFLDTTYSEILSLVPDEKRELLGLFIRELNRREYLVRFEKSIEFDEFEHVENHDIFGTGFQVGNRAVPYFHPNRSFHDEIIWLNDNVFYNPLCKFEDKLINAAIVKFYGPSNTIALLTKDTGKDFIDYDRLINDDDYVAQCMKNLHDAIDNKEKIYGTTELRTSLQTESRNYTRQIVTPYDKLLGVENDPTRKGRGSDMFFWFRKLGPKFKEFYSNKPTMEESFNFLTSFRGIGNYYGYHFSTNLARMPKIGTSALLKGDVEYGLLDEDDDFVAPGVGAMDTIKWFFEDFGISVNDKVGAHLIRAIKENQNSFFGFEGESLMHAKKVSETGKFTTFGCEISCCQFSVFRRLRFNEKLARKRSAAPIGKEKIGVKRKNNNMNSLEDSCELVNEKVENNFNRLPENYNDPFPDNHLEDPSNFKRKNVENLVEKVKKSATVISEVSRKGSANIKIENAGVYGKSEEAFKVYKEVNPKPKTKKKAKTAKVEESKIELMVNILNELGQSEFSHKEVLDLILSKGGLGLKLDSNWKESWAILQEMVRTGKLEKNGRKYNYSY